MEIIKQFFVMLPIIAIVSALIFQLILKSVSTEWCSSQFINETESKIDKKINAVEMDFFKIVLIVGVVLGIVLDIILFATGIYKLNFDFSLEWLGILLLKVLLPVVIMIVVCWFGGEYFFDRYCIKHYGKILAFIDMTNHVKYSMNKIGASVSSERNIIANLKTSKNYGDLYLYRLGNNLNRSIVWALILHRLAGAAVGLMIGFFMAFLFGGSSFDSLDMGFVFFCCFIGDIVGVLLFNLIAKSYCVDKYGYLSVYFQLHINVMNIKSKMIQSGVFSGVQDKTGIASNIEGSKDIENY